jgi:hypothetical protein
MPSDDKPCVHHSQLDGPMMRKLGRWLTPARFRRDSNRWFGWAVSLWEQFGLRFTSNRPPAMTLARPQSFSDLLYSRWVFTSYKFYPQVNLSILPILRESAWRDHPALRPGWSGDGKAMATRPGIGHLASRPATNGADILRSGSFIPEARRHVKTSSASDESGANESGANESGAPSSSGSLAMCVRILSREDGSRAHRMRRSSAPIHLVFRRLYEAEQSKTARSAAGIAETVQALAQRVLVQTERVEQKITASRAAVLPQSQPVFVRQPAPVRVAAEDHPYETFNRGAEPWTQDALHNPAVDIGQITDEVIRQIDQRATAWRERMGKI